MALIYDKWGNGMNDKTSELAARIREVLFYDPDTGIFRWRVKTSRSRRVGGIAGQPKWRGIGRICVDGHLYRAHRLAWLYVYGRWPEGVIDHIDGHPWNNKLSNLRDVSQKLNVQNRHMANKNSQTGFLGVTYNRNKYVARILLDGKLHQIGRFTSPEDAHQAYLAAKRHLHAGCTI